MSDTSSHLQVQDEPRKRGIRGFFQVGKVGLIFACGLALFSDGYVNAISGNVNTLLVSYIYKNEDPATLRHFSSAFTSVAFCGIVVGQLVFGVLADVIGRRFGMIFACLWFALFSILAAGAWGAGGSTGGLFAALIAYRFLIGIGIGAEYPSGSVAASENSEAEGINKNRQQAYFVLATNTALDFGFTIAAFVPLVLLWICGTTNGGLTTVWRVSLGLGAVAPLLILLFRTQMKEPQSYVKNKINYRKMPWLLIFKRYGLRFAGISFAWFLYNWVTFPAGIYSSLILSKIVPDNDLYRTFGWNTLLNFFYIIGTFAGVSVIQPLGPKNCFMLGLVCQSAIAFGLGGGFSSLQNNVPGIVVLYGLFLAFGEFGPGNNLGLLASKAIAPTAVRGLFYGMAAAIGKIGAFSGSYAYGSITDGFSRYPGGDVLQFSGPFYIGGGLALVSCLTIFLTVPKVDADFMKREDAAFIRYLEEHGYDVRELGLTPSAESEAEEERARMTDSESGEIQELKKSRSDEGSNSEPTHKGNDDGVKTRTQEISA